MDVRRSVSILVASVKESVSEGAGNVCRYRLGASIIFTNDIHSVKKRV